MSSTSPFRNFGDTNISKKLWLADIYPNDNDDDKEGLKLNSPATLII